MEESRIEHLKLIQAAATRLGNICLLCKVGTVVLATWILTVAARLAAPDYLLMAFVPAVAFWGLDGHYLRQQRLFRKLYDAVARQTPSEWEDAPFSMDTSAYSSEVASWWHTCRSRTIAALYAPIVVLLLVKAVLHWDAWRFGYYGLWIRLTLGVVAITAGIVVVRGGRRE